MAKRRNPWDIGKSYNYEIRRDIMPPLAAELKLDQLPMKDPNFNFFNAAVSFFSKYSDLKEADLYDAASDVISKILSPTSKGKAPISDYVRRYREQEAAGNIPQPFDRYFNMSIFNPQKGKGWRVLRDLSQQQKKRGLPLDRGRYYGGEGEDLGELIEPESREPSPYEVLRAKEEDPKKEKALKAVPGYLKEQRAAPEVVQMWDMMLEEVKTGKKMTLDMMSNVLNSMGIKGPSDFGDWDHNAAYRLKRKVYNIVQKFMEDSGVDLESIILGSRKGFRFCAQERW